MNFTAFKIPAEALAQRMTLLQAGFQASRKPGSFEENALRVIGERMRAKPAQYLEFGPYWWAVKAALADAGYIFGDHGDPMLAADYAGTSPAQTLVAAEMFKDHYRTTYAVGHSTFDLGDGEDYALEDPDMQARVTKR